MRYTTFFVMVLLAAARTAGAENTAGPAVARVPHCVVTLKEQAELAPHEAGILKEVPVAAGTQVEADQIVLQLDDRKAQAELNIAKAKHFAARTKADDDVNIEYARASAEVAEQELKYNMQANAKVPGSVPQAKLDELKLKVTETRLAIKKATHDRIVAQAEADAALSEVKAAETMVDLLHVRSPIDGVVVDIRAHKGESVQPSQPVLQIMRLDELWVEGDVQASHFSREELDKRPVTVEVGTPHGGKATVQGKIIFVSPATATGDRYTVRALVHREKRDDPWPLHPGMTAEMVIQLGAVETK